MKNVNLFLSTLCILFSYLCSSQTTAIPDPNFEQALIDLGLDDIIDGIVETSNVSGITILNVSNRNISDLSGIEAFVGLTQLYCNNNSLTNLDVTYNTALTLLYCYENNLVNLDVSKNTELTQLNCANNDLLGLNVENNISLLRLFCAGNFIPTLNLSNNTLLTELYCDQNNLTSLDVSANSLLEVINCFGNDIDILDVTNNLALTKLYCYDNSLNVLNVELNTALTDLFCNGNNLTKLNLNNNTELRNLWCQSNNLNSLKVKNGNNPNIVLFNATNNPLLACIDVDDVAYNIDNWDIDPQTGISEECNTALTNVILAPDGSLTISDNIDSSSVDNYAISISNGYLILSNTTPIAVTGDNIIQTDLYTIQIPLENITNVTIDGQGGNNDLTINSPLPLGNNNSLSVKNIRSIVRGNGSINLKALNVTDGDFNITELITIIAIAANFSTNGSLSGKGAIDGNVNMKENSKIKPGNSPGILNTGNLLLEVNSTIDAEVNGVNPGTAHDQVNVIGTVTINNAILNLTGGYESNYPDEIILINNDGTDAIIGTFSNYSEGQNVTFGDFEGYITYSGGDGNDVSLITNEVPSNVDGIIGGINPIGVGTNFNLSANFNDDNLSSVTWYFSSDGDFTNGDIAEYEYPGSYDGGIALGSFTFDASQAGVYSVKVEVVDLYGEVAEAKYNYVVIYDPSGGFVTGGGWIYSPVGALVGSNVEGKANFGLVAKYKTGKNNVQKLDGNTNFQFKDGNFHFKSNLYDEMSLVISGKKKATYRGSGTVNSFGHHKFLVTVIDGDAIGGDGNDKFRIKIWADGSSSKVIYDNEFNASENADSNTILGGGSIVIHEPNGKNSKASNFTAAAEIEDGLELKSWPNPSHSFFNLKLLSDNVTEKFEIQVFDLNNRIILQDSFRPDTVYRFGDSLEAGVYIVRVTQSGKSKIVRVVSH